jgi:hypothetical protein
MYPFAYGGCDFGAAMKQEGSVVSDVNCSRQLLISQKNLSITTLKPAKVETCPLQSFYFLYPALDPTEHRMRRVG